MKATCNVCFRHCVLEDGQLGFCRARTNDGGHIYASNYGMVTALAVDPIEKKPLNRFHPGSNILSVGSYGCNLRCPFCQNSEISMAGPQDERALGVRHMSPYNLCTIAEHCRDEDNSIGLAFTYNEPMIGWEFVRDTAKLIHEAGMLNVLVTNGTASTEILEELLPYVDAMNIDLKCFKDDTYRNYLGGDFPMVKDFITLAAKHCHVELTTLIVPGMNDSEEELLEEADWIAKIDPDIPLHLSRFFPRYKVQDKWPTPIKTVYDLVDVARTKLHYVYPGNC